MLMKDIELDSGKLTININPEMLDNVDVFDALGEIDEKPQLIVKALKTALGADNYKKVREHYVENYGRMSIQNAAEVFAELMKNFPKA